MVTKAQKKATEKYEQQNYDKVLLRMHRGRKAEIKAAADAKGQSLNSFINDAIDAHIAAETSPEPFTPPTGEYCPEDCPKRGEIVRGRKQCPWCFRYAKEITERNGTGKLWKLGECLHGKQAR